MPSPQKSSAPIEAYSLVARKFHWWTVAFVAVLVPLGVAMSYRGNTLNIWDATTNNLYSMHKLLGFTLFWIIVLRFAYRLRAGAPPDEPTLEWWQKLASHVTHWALYGLLLLVPLLGWLGVSMFGARDIFGLFSLPPLAPVDQGRSALILTAHKAGAILLVLTIGAHVGAALFHYVIRKDGVMSRMLPGLKKRS